MGAGATVMGAAMGRPWLVTVDGGVCIATLRDGARVIMVSDHGLDSSISACLARVQEP